MRQSLVLVFQHFQQSIDFIGQLLGHIAAVTRSSDPNGAVERIGMCELKARLTRYAVDKGMIDQG